MHVAFMRHAATLAQVAGRAGGDHVVPAGQAAERARRDMIESQLVPAAAILAAEAVAQRSEEHTSELQSLMRISYAVFCLKKKKIHSSLQKRKCRSRESKQ